MRLIFMGTPEFAVPSLRALVRGGHEVAAAVTRPDRQRRRRSSRPGSSPVKIEAGRLGIPLWQPDSVRAPEFVDAAREAAPDTIVVVAFGQILPPELLDLPRGWCINLHASLLPAYRGAAPIARAIMAGEARTGLTTMRIDRGLDTGDILLARAVDIHPRETAGELTARLAGAGADLLLETLESHARGALQPRPQDPSRATQAPPLKREDGSIDWEAPARAISNRVRGCNPWPCAAAGLKGVRIQILRAMEEPGDPELGASRDAPARNSRVPGDVVRASGGQLLVACGGGTLLSVQELRFPGGRALTARDALNGRLVAIGDCFTAPPS